MNDKKRFTFLVGFFEPRRTAFVFATNKEEAFLFVRAKLDNEAMQAGQEPPIAWDLELIED